MLMATEPSALRMMKNGPGYDQDQKSTFAPSIISGGCFILLTVRLVAQRPPNAVGCSGLLGRQALTQVEGSKSASPAPCSFRHRPGPSLDQR